MRMLKMKLADEQAKAIRVAEEVAELRADRGAYRESRREAPVRPKAVTDFSGIKVGMKPAEYRAVKAGIWGAFEFNIDRCEWLESDCIVHMIRHLPRTFKTQTVKMKTLDELSDYLDEIFERSTDDVEEEEWDEARIGDKAVTTFHQELTDMADRLGKSREEIKKAFIKGVKHDYGDLWQKMRTDWKSHSVERLVKEAREWIELTKSRGTGGQKRSARVAAVEDGIGATEDSAIRNLKGEMNGKIENVQKSVESVLGAIKTLIPTAAVREDGNDRRESGVDRSRTFGDRQSWTRQDLGKLVAPKGWVDARVVRVTPPAGVARMELLNPKPGETQFANVLRISAPFDVRKDLKVDDLWKIIVEQDDIGFRVTDMKKN